MAGIIPGTAAIDAITSAGTATVTATGTATAATIASDFFRSAVSAAFIGATTTAIAGSG